MHRTGYTLYTFIQRFDLDSTGNLLSNPDIVSHPLLAMNLLINYICHNYIFERPIPLGSSHHNKDVCAFEAWVWASHLLYMSCCNKEYRDSLKIAPDITSNQPPRQKIFDGAIAQGLANIHDFTGWQCATLWQRRFWSYMEASLSHEYGAHPALFDYNIFSSISSDRPQDLYKKDKIYNILGSVSAHDINSSDEILPVTMIKMASLTKACRESYNNLCREFGWNRF